MPTITIWNIVLLLFGNGLLVALVRVGGGLRDAVRDLVLEVKHLTHRSDDHEGRIRDLELVRSGRRAVDSSILIKRRE